MNQVRGSHDGKSKGSRANWVLIGFVAIAALLLFTEHRAHLLGVLPFLLLLACPLMHLFMHGGHGHRHSGQDEPRGHPSQGGQA